MLPQIILFAAVVVGVIVSVVKGLAIQLHHRSISLYWLIALGGAVLAVALGFVPMSEIKDAFFTDTAVNPLKILVLFFSMTAISVFLDEAGFYGFLASVVVKKAGSSQKKCFFILFALVSVLTVFTSNDIIILTFTPFILYFAHRSGIDPIPYIFGEFVAANTWSMFFVFGNPTNIYISSAFGIDFVAYSAAMIPATAAAGVCALGLLYLIFRRRLSKPIVVGEERPPEWSKPLSAIGLVFLGLCIVCMAAASYVGFEMWIVAFGFAAACLIIASAYLLVKRRGLRMIRGTAHKLPWALMPFLLSMFILIISLDSSGVTALLAGKLPKSTFVYGVTSFLACNLLNNIPMSVLFTSLLNGAEATSGMVYAVVVGSNLGALLTPVGALAGIMWLNIVKGHSVKFGFGGFVKYGSAIAIPTLLAALGVLILV